jgi:hypothetical protein
MGGRLKDGLNRRGERVGLGLEDDLATVFDLFSPIDQTGGRTRPRARGP